jgi:hypothetical protein
MTLNEEPKTNDLFARKVLLDPYALSNQTVAEYLVEFTALYDTNGTISCERIEAVAAELARQFWLEIEGKLAYQSTALDRWAGSGADVGR